MDGLDAEASSETQCTCLRLLCSQTSTATIRGRCRCRLLRPRCARRPPTLPTPTAGPETLKVDDDDGDVIRPHLFRDPLLVRCLRPDKIIAMALQVMNVNIQIMRERGRVNKTDTISPVRNVTI